MFKLSGLSCYLRCALLRPASHPLNCAALRKAWHERTYSQARVFKLGHGMTHPGVCTRVCSAIRMSHCEAKKSEFCVFLTLYVRCVLCGQLLNKTRFPQNPCSQFVSLLGRFYKFPQWHLIPSGMVVFNQDSIAFRNPPMW